MKIFLKKALALAFGMGSSYASKDGNIVSTNLYPTIQTQNVLNHINQSYGTVYSIGDMKNQEKLIDIYTLYVIYKEE